jgi:predicted kinase
MRRFAPDSTLDALLRDGKLAPDVIDALARKVAAFHGSIPVAAPADGHGSLAQVREAALDNFRQSRPYVQEPARLAALDQLFAWTQTESRHLAATFEERQRRGFVRECHGDLHLANIALIDGEPVLFDCIDFNASLRWIDVMSEAAFTTMDLIAHGEQALAFRFLNAYLEETGDYKGVGVLRYYLVYRAMVRAKVAAIQQRGADFERYLRFAGTLAGSSNPALVITCGLSGSGKTTFARALAGRIGAVHVRSDVERKRLHGLASRVRARAALESGIYASRSTATTYERLARIARSVVHGGLPVIVDATFLHRSQRRAFRDLARRVGARFVIVRCEAPLAALRARLEAREGTGDASDATAAVLDRQLEIREGFTRAETEAAVDCDTLDRRKIAEAYAEVERRLAVGQEAQPA